MTEIPVMLSPNTGKYKPEKTPYLDTFSNNVKKIKQGQHLCRSITKISSAEIFQI